MEAASWLELLGRSGVLLAGGWAIHSLSRKASPAFRHRLLVWVVGLLAMLPLLSAVLPAIPVRPARNSGMRQTGVTVVENASLFASAKGTSSRNWLLIVWAVGAIAAGTPLLAGSILIAQLARRATPFRHEPGVRLSNELTIPLTYGSLRPLILLPADAEEWSAARLQAVLAHERAHVRRRDVAVQTAAHIVAALWWFQPLVWLLRRQLRTESEFACDAEAVIHGLRASDYAAELLAIGRLSAKRAKWPVAAIGMVRSNDLGERVRALLAPPTSYFPRSRGYQLTALLAAVSIGASATTLSGGSMFKRTLLSALLTSAALSANTITGVVHDDAGNALTDAKVTMSPAEGGERQEVSTGADGRFSLTTNSRGQYLLHIEKAGYQSVFTEYSLDNDRNVSRDFTLVDNGTPKRIRVGGNVAQSNITEKAQPVYPAAAKAAGIQGTVEIEAVISKDGMPLELRVVASPSDDLAESALNAVRRWRYRPTLLNGNPVEIVTTVIVNYTLSQ